MRAAMDMSISGDAAASEEPTADVFPDEVELSVPGTFVVFQGIPGDGMSNTIDTAPFLMEDYDHLIEMEQQNQDEDSSGYLVGASHHSTDHDVISYDDSSSSGEGQQQQQQRPAAATTTMTAQASPMMMGAYNSLLHTNPGSPVRGGTAAAAAAASTAMAPLALTAAAPTAPPPATTTRVDSSFVVVTDEDESQRRASGLSRVQWDAIGHWETECRNREVRERKDWMSLQTETEEDIMWWQSQGRLAVLQALPVLEEENRVQCEDCGSLAPGSTVVGDQLITLDSTTFEEIKDSTRRKKKQSHKHPRLYPRGKKGVIQMLRIESPMIGFVVLSLDGYAFLGPGLPSIYASWHSWMWRVTCPDGAFVRDGLELTSTHVETLPYGSFLRISRKTVNSMGLSRLRVHATVTDNRDDGSTAAVSRAVEGWISEELNPLSGQRGYIVQPLPFPVPVLYRVRLAAGAVIRSDVELSSPEIGQAPFGAILTIVGRAFSQHPMDQCIERFQLAGCGGWVSVRLNRAPPNNELVLEMVGVDGSFDPESPGVFHLNAHDKVKAEQQQDASPDSVAAISPRDVYRRVSSTGELSSINEETSSSSSSSLSPLESTTSNAVPTLYRRGVGGGSRSSSLNKMARRDQDEHCLICLTEDRNSTIVHGETGHIACCLKCARILKARGDKCPVCRLKIDSVIQHFWA